MFPDVPTSGIIYLVYYPVRVCAAGLSIWFHPYVYLYVWPKKTPLFCVLQAINRRQDLSTAFSYVAKDAVNTKQVIDCQWALDLCLSISAAQSPVTPQDYYCTHVHVPTNW